MVSYQPATGSYIQAFMAARAIRRERNQERRVIVRNGVVDVSNVFRVILHLIGFACVSIAGFQFNAIAGLLVVGFSCFAFSWMAAPTSGNVRN